MEAKSAQPKELVRDLSFANSLDDSMLVLANPTKGGTGQ